MNQDFQMKGKKTKVGLWMWKMGMARGDQQDAELTTSWNYEHLVPAHRMWSPCTGFCHSGSRNQVRGGQWACLTHPGLSLRGWHSAPHTIHVQQTPSHALCASSTLPSVDLPCCVPPLLLGIRWSGKNKDHHITFPHLSIHACLSSLQKWSAFTFSEYIFSFCWETAFKKKCLLKSELVTTHTHVCKDKQTKMNTAYRA